MRPGRRSVALLAIAVFTACSSGDGGEGERRPAPTATVSRDPGLDRLTGADLTGRRLAVYTVDDDTIRFVTPSEPHAAVAVRSVKLTSIPYDILVLGRDLAVVHQNNSIALLDPVNGSQRASRPISANDVGLTSKDSFRLNQLRRSPDGRQVWIEGNYAGAHGMASVVAHVDPSTFRVRASYRIPDEPVQDLAVSNSRALVLLSSGLLVDPRAVDKPVIPRFQGDDRALAVVETQAGVWSAGKRTGGASYLRTPAGTFLDLPGLPPDGVSPDVLLPLSDGGIAALVRGADELWLLTPAGEVRARVSVPSQAVDLDVDNANSRAYVTSAGPANSLTIVDLASGTVLRSVYAGPYASLTRVLPR